MKVVAVGVLSFGVIDFIDGADVNDDGPTTIGYDHSASISPSDGDVALVDKTNNHHVEPHWRTLPDGTQSWFYGDGNTSVHTNAGWIQIKLDYRVKG